MRPPDLPLLLASQRLRPALEAYPLDRIRMQKAVFLTGQRGSAEWRSLYQYEAYDWGPYSRQLSRDISELLSQRLIRMRSVHGNRHGEYVTTSEGEQAAATVWAALQPKERSFLTEIREYVTARSFSQLLREVYAAYPDYAVKSRFDGS